MIDRHHLAILREIDRLGSLTLAADRLNLTQSAISHTMRKFEDRFGVKVWEKQGRGPRFTQAGEFLLALAHRVLPQFDHAEQVLVEFAQGHRGALRTGMECHPCQHWLMRVIAPYLKAWPDVDLDLRTAFRFGGIGALLGHEIDLLITPDPLDLPGIHYTRVFDYELVLAVPEAHAIGAVARPQDLTRETLITYPVSPERLDIFTQFLVPGHCLPKRHRTVETTEMMLQLVAAERGVSAVPDWILREEGAGLPVRAVRLGQGISKGLHIGVRKGEQKTDYIAGFLALARQAGAQPVPE
ncbi:LysR family transcriptional regulator [Paracoccus kondratievae]|uniref:LysR family transcriptional regulator n=1 Tax=Paracoccus kondratievae TaxID=135740 RepID=UPI0012661E8A|nr:LysR family transcriptional regulator [Paracoccus kondratievae]QFQ88781.1 LysR family transcriptional regulator [Paracoccus kondratievae]